MENINIAPIATDANGIPVFTHPAGHPHRPELIAETISKIKLSGTFCRQTIDLGRTIGKDHLVETAPGDTIVYLRRGNRPGETRMVLKEAADTSFVTIILCVAQKDNDTPDDLVGKWVVVTLFEGQPGEREPWDRAFEDADIDEDVAAAKSKAEAFWATHALVPTDAELEEMKKNGNFIPVITTNTKYGVWFAEKDREFNSLGKAVAYAEYAVYEEREMAATVAICYPGFGKVVKTIYY